jgi:glycopeptide antibiotics resistance protein
MNKYAKTLLSALFLVAYLAVLLKFMMSTHPLPPGMGSPGMGSPDIMGPPGGGVVPGAPEIAHNYVPFKTILPYLRGHPTWRDALRNLLGNILLFLPLGFLLPLLYRRISWKSVLGIAAALSLGIETLQLTLRAGIFDVDDLLLNALGALLGYLAFLLLTNQPLPRWGTVRLRMTLWNVAVLALILGAMGIVVRYTVQADRFAAVDRTLAERANEAAHQYRFLRSHTVQETRATGRSTWLDPMAKAAEGMQSGSRPGGRWGASRGTLGSTRICSLS